MSVVIVDYGSGNLRSAEKAVARAAHEAGLSSAVTVTADPARVAKADHIILPGVGAFADCMMGLSATHGMVEAILDAVTDRGVPLRRPPERRPGSGQVHPSTSPAVL